MPKIPSWVGGVVMAVVLVLVFGRRAPDAAAAPTLNAQAAPLGGSGAGAPARSRSPGGGEVDVDAARRARMARFDSVEGRAKAAAVTAQPHRSATRAAGPRRCRFATRPGV